MVGEELLDCDRGCDRAGGGLLAVARLASLSLLLAIRGRKVRMLSTAYVDCEGAYLGGGCCVMLSLWCVMLSHCCVMLSRCCVMLG